MPYIPSYLCDLHCHTKRSDGFDEPWELIERAGSLGMKIIAITDHDVIPPESIVKNGLEMDIDDYAGRIGVKYVKGMEISCDTDVEDVHILAYGCNWKDTFFSNLTAKIELSKIEGYRALTRALCRNNINVSWEEVLQHGSLDLKPEKVQKKHIFEMIANKGYTRNWQEAKILTQQNPDLDIKREKPYPLDVINEIHKAGGIAVLAHPYLIDENLNTAVGTLTREKYIQILINGGLNGIEACYTYDKTSYKGKMTKEEIFMEVVSKYKNRVEVLSGGADYHGDDKRGVTNARLIGECGVHVDYFESNALLSRL